MAATDVELATRDPIGTRRLIRIEKHRSAIVENIIELTVIEIKALSRLQDLGVRFDLFDADNGLIFYDWIRRSESRAGCAVAKKFIMTNEEKVFLLLGKEFLDDDVVPFKDRGRYFGEAVIDSVVEWRFEAGTVGITSNKTMRQQPSPKRWVSLDNPFR